MFKIIFDQHIGQFSQINIVARVLTHVEIFEAYRPYPKSQSVFLAVISYIFFLQNHDAKGIMHIHLMRFPIMCYDNNHKILSLIIILVMERTSQCNQLLLHNNHQ